MKQKIIILILLIFVLITVGCGNSNKINNSYPSHEQVEVSSLAVKSLERYTSDGELWFSAKLTVKNNLPSKEIIEVAVQGIDKDGFEIEDIWLQGNFQPGEEKILTNSTFTPRDVYNNVVKWQIRKVELL